MTAQAKVAFVLYNVTLVAFLVLLFAWWLGTMSPSGGPICFKSTGETISYEKDVSFTCIFDGRSIVNGNGLLAAGETLKMYSMNVVDPVPDPKSWEYLSKKIVAGDVYPSLVIGLSLVVFVEALYQKGFITEFITALEEQYLVNGLNFVASALADVFLNDGPFSTGPLMYISLCVLKISFMALYAEKRIMEHFLSLLSFQMVALTVIHFYERDWLPMVACIFIFGLYCLVRRRQWALLRPATPRVRRNQELKEIERSRAW